MEVVITGATGFVGRHLVAALLKRGIEVAVIARPSSNVSTWSKKKVDVYRYDGDVKKLVSYFRRRKFEGCVHLASKFVRQHQVEEVGELVEASVGLPSAVLEACVRSEVSWFVNTGTFWQHYQNKDYSPVNLYAAMKQAFEDVAQYYWEVFPIRFVTLVLSDTFGANDTRPKIFNLWQEQVGKNNPLKMSPGEQVVDINHIDDVVGAYLRLIELLGSGKKYKGKVFALKSGKRYSLRELHGLFEEATGMKVKVEWGGRAYSARQVMKPWDGGESIPGWKPKTSVVAGIKKTFKTGAVDDEKTSN